MHYEDFFSFATAIVAVVIAVAIAEKSTPTTEKLAEEPAEQEEPAE